VASCSVVQHCQWENEGLVDGTGELPEVALWEALQEVETEEGMSELLTMLHIWVSSL
jgi:hypothetical protein